MAPGALRFAFEQQLVPFAEQISIKNISVVLAGPLRTTKSTDVGCASRLLFCFLQLLHAPPVFL